MISLHSFSNESNDPFFGMALDDTLLQESIADCSHSPLIRFYHFDITATTIGFSQRNSELIQKVRSLRMPWVRRPTGGGVVLHDDDLIYALVLPIFLSFDFLSPTKVYCLIHGILRETLEFFGIDSVCCQSDNLVVPPDELICFDRPVMGDIMIGTKKIVGSAQRRSGQYLLQQGSIQIKDLEKAGAEKDAFCDSLQEEFISRLCRQFGWSKESCRLPYAVREKAQRCCNQKYRKPLWNLKGHIGSSKQKISPPIHVS